MLIKFIKVHSKGYEVIVERDGHPLLRMRTAPGYDDYMPHDLQHFIVEKAMGIQDGIFGQLASGGYANTFEPQLDLSTRDAARLRRKMKKKNAKISSRGQHGSMRSERATYIAWQNWLENSDNPTLKSRGRNMAPTAQDIRDTMPSDELSSYSPQAMAYIRSQMDECSELWQKLEIGEALSLFW